MTTVNRSDNELFLRRERIKLRRAADRGDTAFPPDFVRAVADVLGEAAEEEGLVPGAGLTLFGEVMKNALGDEDQTNDN